MPWNDQSGGGQGPWGQPPRGGPQRGGDNRPPPDLEDMIRNLQGRMGGVFGSRGGRGGRGGGGAIFLIFAVALLVWAAWPGAWYYIVQAEEEAIVLRFGEVERRVTPGLHFKFPDPVETVLRAPVRRQNVINISVPPRGQEIDFANVDPASAERLSQQIQLDESMMLTGDENIVDLDFSVRWRIRDIEAYLFNVANPEDALRNVAQSAMREVVGGRQLEPIITDERDAVAVEAQTRIQEILDEYGAGILISQVLIADAGPPVYVAGAFRDVVTARQDSEASVNEANRHRNRVLPEARAAAARIEQDAIAYRDRVIAQARGEASRFTQIFEQYDVAPFVTRRRMYLETMQSVFGRSNMVLLDGAAGEGVVPYLPLDELTRPRPAQGE